MRDEDRLADRGGDPLEPPANNDAHTALDAETAGEDDLAFDESITEEIAALIDDGRTYAEAELAFQKTRAALAGKNIGLAIGFVVVALVLFNIAVIALAVGAVMALEPLVTIWGAIAIVVGVLLLAVLWLLLAAKGRADLIGEIFGSSKDGDA